MEKVNIINQESIPLNFSFDRNMGPVRVAPKSGVIAPGAALSSVFLLRAGESVAVEVRFAPSEEKFYNLNAPKILIDFHRF